jgi:putative membrane protein
MIITKKYNLKKIIRFTGRHTVWLCIWAVMAVTIYVVSGWKWLNIPWLPLSVLGTAVAFYVGFKNNSAYDRMWEARKIWGAIVNSSRAWGSTVKSFVSNQFAENPVPAENLASIKKRLIYRHIAWLYALRGQLLANMPWEHVSQQGHVGRKAHKYRKHFGVGLVDDEVTRVELELMLPKGEYEEMIRFKNAATQIMDRQAEELAGLREQGLINDFRHVALQELIYHFFEHQGKCERIKKFPLPRQYAYMSFVFIDIFIFLLPFGMVSELSKLGSHGVWLAVPFTILVGWIFIVMEIIGDYSENPFQGMANDIPMLSICRGIEIDLMEMLGETKLPPEIEAKDGILM